MPGESWVGLNDINIENQFVYTDGTPAVSDKAVNALCDILGKTLDVSVCRNAAVRAVFVFSQDFLPWGNNQPDNWQNEDCVHLRGMDQEEPGTLSDDFCTSTKDFICKKGLMHYKVYTPLSFVLYSHCIILFCP